MRKKDAESQICTTREQSQRLLAMGLKPETADMVYHYTGSSIEALQWDLQATSPTLRGEVWTPERIAKLARRGESGEEVFDRIWGKDVPAWSLGRLLEILPKFIEVNEFYDLIISIGMYDYDWYISYQTPGVYKEYQVVNHNLYEALIQEIELMVRDGHMSKEYVTEEE